MASSVIIRGKPSKACPAQVIERSINPCFRSGLVLLFFSFSPSYASFEYQLLALQLEYLLAESVISLKHAGTKLVRIDF